MASNKRKQDEKHLKILRNMVAMPHNKQCFDCHQRGPTYVNMTAGSFVCTSCSGLLRGLNPPHRVKSISMSSFTPDEMEFLMGRGNDLCQRVWLGLYDNRSHLEPDSKDENKIKDFMAQKYERKRYYVAPTETMYEESRQMNASASDIGGKKTNLSMMNRNKQQQIISQRPRGSLTAAATAIPKPVAPPPSSSTPSQPAAQSSASTPEAAPTSATAPKPKPSSSAFDLLGDLGGDPFAGGSNPAPPQPAAQSGVPNFANFGAFSSAPSSVPGQSFPSSQGGFAEFGGGGGTMVMAGTAPTQTVTTAPPPPTTNTQQQQQQQQQQDRYAALANLDSAFNSSSTTTGAPTTEAFGSGSTSALNGGGGASSTMFGGGAQNTSTSVFGGASDPPSSAFGGGGPAPATSVPGGFGGWDNNPGGFSGSTGGWGAGPQPANVAPDTVPPSGGGYQYYPAVPPPQYYPAVSAAVPPGPASGSANLFGASSQPPPANPFAGPAAFPPQHPPPAYSNFAQQGQFPPSQPAPAPGPPASSYGQMPNGARGWGGFGGAPQGGFAAAPPQQQQQQFGKAAPGGFAGGWGAPQQPQQAAHNPFMNMASGPPQAALPRSNSTNPFL